MIKGIWQTLHQGLRSKRLFGIQRKEKEKHIFGKSIIWKNISYSHVTPRKDNEVRKSYCLKTALYTKAICYSCVTLRKIMSKKIIFLAWYCILKPYSIHVLFLKRKMK